MDLVSSNSTNYNSQHNAVELYTNTEVNTAESNDLLISKSLRSLEIKSNALLSSTLSNGPSRTLKYKPIVLLWVRLIDELNVILLRLFLLVSYLRTTRKYCVHKINHSRNFDGFTHFQHPWIWKLIFEMPSLFIYVCNICIYVCMYVRMYVCIFVCFFFVCMWALLTPGKLDGFYCGLQNPPPPPVTSSSRMECNDMVIVWDTWSM
jgi:hypothetical protein